MKITNDSVYCITCGAPSTLFRVYKRTKEYRCEGGQNCGYFEVVIRSSAKSKRREGK